MQFRGLKRYVLATLAALASPMSLAMHFTQQNGIASEQRIRRDRGEVGSDRIAN
jgi:hypothetical protein